MGNNPIHANPLSDAAKERIFSNQSITKADDMLKNYVDAFLAENGLKSRITPSVFWRRILFSVVYSLLVFILIVIRCLYHTSGGFLFLLFFVLTAVYVVLMLRTGVKKWLLKEVKKRPQDPIDNILASQVSGLKRGWLSLVLAIALPIVTLLGSAILFFKPHIIYERNNYYGYSVRYYTLAIRSEDTVVIPDTYKGRPVNEIRGSTFLKMGFSSIKLPASLNEIRGNTFEACKNLRSIDIPSGVTRIGGSAFQNCSALKRVTLPSTLKEIGGSAFRDCVNLDDISLSQTKLTRIGTSAFRGCRSLKSVTLPATVTSIGDSAFRECFGLKKITIPLNARKGDKVFKNTPAEIEYY